MTGEVGRGLGAKSSLVHHVQALLGSSCAFSLILSVRSADGKVLNMFCNLIYYIT
jgi:hypothetical protein